MRLDVLCWPWNCFYHFDLCVYFFFQKYNILNAVVTHLTNMAESAISGTWLRIIPTASSPVPGTILTETKTNLWQKCKYYIINMRLHGAYVYQLQKESDISTLSTSRWQTAFGGWRKLSCNIKEKCTFMLFSNQIFQKCTILPPDNCTQLVINISGENWVAVVFVSGC